MVKSLNGEELEGRKIRLNWAVNLHKWAVEIPRRKEKQRKKEQDAKWRLHRIKHQKKYKEMRERDRALNKGKIKEWSERKPNKGKRKGPAQHQPPAKKRKEYNYLTMT